MTAPLRAPSASRRHRRLRTNQAAADRHGDRRGAAQTTPNGQFEVLPERTGVIVDVCEPDLARQIEVPISLRADRLPGDHDRCAGRTLTMF